MSLNILTADYKAYLDAVQAVSFAILKTFEQRGIAIGSPPAVVMR